MDEHRFPIGTQYITVRGTGRKTQRDINTVVDQLTVTNAAGEVIRRFYASEHPFCGQMVRVSDVGDTTIARNLAPAFQHLLA